MRRVFLSAGLVLSLLDASCGARAEVPARDVEMRELWRRGGDDDDLIFGVIMQLVEDSTGRIYLLDTQLNTIHVLDRDGAFVQTIGREGEGPGEFRGSLDMCLAPGGLLGVVQVFPGKIVQLTREGDPAPNFVMPEVAGSGFSLLYVARGASDRIVMAGGVPGQATNTNYLRAVSATGELLATYHEETTPMKFGGMQFQEKTHRDFVRRWALAKDGRVAAALEFDAYKIHVWKPDGELERIIDLPDYPLLKRSKEERQLIGSLYEGITAWNPNSTYNTAETHMTVAQMTFRDDGTLWVLPADGLWKREDGVFSSYDVFDLAGKYRERVHLRGPGDAIRDALFFSQDRAYVVTDLLGASMGAMGREDSSGGDAEPVQIIAYELVEKE
jgi:hypothetical protein